MHKIVDHEALFVNGLVSAYLGLPVRGDGCICGAARVAGLLERRAFAGPFQLCLALVVVVSMVNPARSGDEN